MSEEGFSFPVLTSQEAQPLTARSTVTSITSTGRSEPQPLQAAMFKSNRESRNKVPLEKGYSQVDWMKLTRQLEVAPPRRDITLAEVRQHKTPDDAWMIFHNRVYNITPYLRFHPGGSDMLMKAAGKDGTSLILKYHPWVAIDALMGKHLVGVLQQPGEAAAPPEVAAAPMPQPSVQASAQLAEQLQSQANLTHSGPAGSESRALESAQQTLQAADAGAGAGQPHQSRMPDEQG